MEAMNIQDVEFKIMVIKMLRDLRRRMDNLSENLDKQIGSIKRT